MKCIARTFERCANSWHQHTSHVCAAPVFRKRAPVNKVVEVNASVTHTMLPKRMLFRGGKEERVDPCTVRKMHAWAATSAPAKTQYHAIGRVKVMYCKCLSYSIRPYNLLFNVVQQQSALQSNSSLPSTVQVASATAT